MIVISLTMLVIVLAAVLIVAYFAYPHRGHPVPRFPRLGPALDRAGDRLGIHEGDPERSNQQSSARPG
jgi:hypothetical protein